MRQKAEYGSAVRSRNLIRQALLELIREKELEKITVTDIIQRAGLNRGTFYAHYRDKRDVLDQMENEMLGELLRSLEQLWLSRTTARDFFETPLPYLKKAFPDREDGWALGRALLCSPEAEPLLEKLRTSFADFICLHIGLLPTEQGSSPRALRVLFFVGGVTRLYQLWMRGELPLSYEELLVRMSEIIHSSAGLLQDSAQLRE